MRVGIELPHHADEAFLPLEVQTGLRLVHKEYVGLAVLGEDGEEDEEHLLLAA